MTDRGMLFVPSLARSILLGEKTETRRPMGSDNTVGFVRQCRPDLVVDYQPQASDCRIRVGDHLWVREAWRVIPSCTDDVSALVSYRAGGANVRCKLPPDVAAAELSKWSRLTKKGLPRWTPSLLMPRWAARSVRPVLSVQAERLGPLTDEQARDEGFGSPVEFRNAWDAIYRAKGQAMAARPWVWVIRFGMPEAPER